MMSSSPDHRESARQRALRIRLDYVHHRDSLARVKLLLTWLACLLAAAYCGAVILVPHGGHSQFAPNQVASAHQHFQDDCQACHADFVPLRADASMWPAWLIGAAPRVDPTAPDRGPAHGIIAKRCQTCHVAAPHHRLERPADVAACSTCHVDHQGTAANLRQVANQQCTACHIEIAAHRVGPSSLQPELQNVREFTNLAAPAGVGHPEFRSLQNDPGTIKFQHHLHLLPGLPAKDAAGRPGRPLKTLADLPAEVAARYRRSDQPAGAKPDHEYLVQLDCSSCHTTDDAAAENVAPNPPSGGDYYRPIDFERHCRDCHPLPFEATRPDARLPHGLKAADITTYLAQFYASAALNAASPDSSTDKPGVVGEPWRPQRLVPGRSGDPAARAEVERTVAQQVTLAQQFLKRQAVCTKCHDQRVVQANDPAGEELSPQVAAAAIPTYWLRHARFSHAPHQGLFCGECHAAATAPSSGVTQPPPDRELVMIAGRDTCVRCHAKSSARSEATGSVRADCVLCHRYHGADHATRPDTAPAGVPHSPVGPRRTIGDWLAPASRPKP